MKGFVMEKTIDLRIQRTYKSLTDAFITMLSEKKFEDITVNELCDRAMIRRPTFYKHFADKYEFFTFFIRQVHDEYIASYEQMHDKEESYYVYLFKKGLYFLKEHAALVQRIWESNMMSTLIDMFYEEVYRSVLLHLKKEHTLSASHLSPEVLAAFYAGGIVRLYQLWANQNPAITEEELISQFSSLSHSFALQ